MKYIRIGEIIKESLPVLTVCAAISIFSGLFLNRSEDMLRLLPGILVIIPSFIAVNGNISSVITSRLSSALHMGLVKPRFHRTKLLTSNLISMIFVSVVAFPIIGLFAGLLNFAFGGSAVGFFVFPLVTTLAGMTTAAILISVSMVASYMTFRHGLDPDNVVVPVLTTTGDFVGILVLLVVTALVV